MEISDFDYELPPELIARFPLPNRTASRLLHVPHGPRDFSDLKFTDLVGLLRTGDLLVLNDTRVLPARISARKRGTLGKVEILIERLAGDRSILAQLRCSKRPKVGQQLETAGGARLEIIGSDGEFFILESAGDTIADLMERDGRMPIPPYLSREDSELDRDRYQTVYSRVPGAVAAPTAGLHFDQGYLDRLKEAGIEIGYLTLHVGAGTFQPVRVSDVTQHQMHAERFSIDDGLAAQVAQVRRHGGRVVAVGTTVCRALESSAVSDGKIGEGAGETRLFIYPGYRFQVVDAMLTNFHLPRSTLIMMVSAMAGRARILAAYRHAVEKGYRFFSYGDAMFIEGRGREQ